jgi:opine dehydrogenase
MRVAVIGAGGVGLGSAALLAQSGHDVVLWSPSLPEGGGELVASGAIIGRFPVATAVDLAAAVSGAHAVLIAAPGNAHRALFDALAPALTDTQTVIIGSHCSLGGLYLRRLLAARGCPAAIVAWGTTVVTGRRQAALACHVSNLRSKVDAAGTTAALALCENLFGDRLVPRAGLLAIQLSNLNPQNHLGMALCNLTRIERGDYWGITPSVARLIEALDAERLTIAAAFGLRVRSVHDHFHLSFQVPRGSLADMARAVDARGDAPLGPKTLATRYVLEDVPFGIVPLEVLAGIADVPVPLHRAGVDMFSALYGRDFRAENDLLPALGHFTTEELSAALT